MITNSPVLLLQSLSLPLLVDLPSLSALYLQNADRSQANGVCLLPNYKAQVLQQVTFLRNLDGER